MAAGRAGTRIALRQAAARHVGWWQERGVASSASGVALVGKAHFGAPALYVRGANLSSADGGKG
jgi:hypothetical protein